MSVKLFTTFTALLLVFSIEAKGIEGIYEIQGKAYNAQKELIRNGELTTTVNGRQQQIKTDSSGNYVLRIFWGYPCRSVHRYIGYRKAFKQQNPKKIYLFSSGEKAVIRNKWKRYRNKSGIILDLYFK